MINFVPDATLTSVLGGCQNTYGPFLLIPVLFESFMLDVHDRRSHHRLEAVRPTSGSVIIAGVIHRRHVQQAVVEGRLLKCERAKAHRLSELIDSGLVSNDNFYFSFQYFFFSLFALLSISFVLFLKPPPHETHAYK